MATDVDSALQDLTRKSRAFSAFRQQLVADSERGDFAAVEAAVRKRTEGADPDEAARLWLATAERWASGSREIRVRALFEAASAAWQRPEMFQFLERAFANAEDIDGQEATLRARATHATTADDRAAAWERIGDLLAGATRPDDAVDAYVSLARLRPESAVLALDRIAPLAEMAEPARWFEAQETIARATADTRTLLRVLDGKFQRALGGHDRALFSVTSEAARCAMEAGAGLDTALGYLETVWHEVPDLRPNLFSLAESLAQGGAHERAAEHIASMALGLNDAASAATWRRTAAKAAAQPDRAAAHWLAAAELEAPTNLVGALEAFEQAALADPSALATVRGKLEALEASAEGDDVERVRTARAALLESGGDWVGLHDVLMSRIQSASGDARALLLIELSALQNERLARPDLAAISLSQALDGASRIDTTDAAVAQLEPLLLVDSSASRAATALASYYRNQSDSENLLRTLEVVSRTSTDDAERGAAFDEMGRLAADAGDQPNAIEAMRNARALGALSDETRLRTLLREGEHYQEAMTLLAEAIETASPEDRTALEIERARTLASAGAQAQAMAYAHVARTMVADPDAIDAVFDELAASEGNVDAATRAAERLARHNKQTAADLLWRVARVAGLGQPDGVALALAAAAVAPMDAARNSQLQTAVGRSGKPEDAIAMQRALLAHAADADAKLSAQRALAQLLATDAPDEARAFAYAALDVSADDLAMHDTLLTIARDGEDAAAIAQALEGRLEHLTLDADEAVAHLWELTSVYGDALGRQDLAFQSARRLMQISPMHADALALVRSYSETVGDPRLRYDTLSETLDDIEGPADRAVRRLELAEIAESLHATDAAATHLLLAAGEPEFPTEARVAAADRALTLRLGAADGAGAVEALTLLAPMLNDTLRTQRSEETVDRLESDPAAAFLAASAALEGWESPAASVLDRHAQLAQRVGEPAAAIASLKTWIAQDGDGVPVDRRAQLAVLLLDADATDGDAWDAATDVLSRAPDQMDLVLKLEEIRGDGARVSQLASALAERTTDAASEHRIRALYRAADLVVSDDDAAAEGYWRQILALAPTEAKALDSLRGALRERGDAEAESAVLQGLLGHVPDDARADILREIATLAESAADKERAQLDVLEADLSDVPSRLVLAELYEESERFERAVEMLEEAAPLTSDDLDAKALWLRAAALSANKLNDADRAATHLKAIVLSNPTDIPILERLAASYREREIWPELAKTLRHRAGVTSDSDVKARLLTEIATVEEVQCENPAGAIEALEQASALEPKNLTVLQDIARLHEEGHDWNAFVHALDRMAQAAPIPALREEILLRAAPVLLRNLNRPSDAQNLLQQAFANNRPTADQLDLLREAAKASEDWIPFAGTLRTLAERETDSNAREDLEVEVAETLANKANDPLTAITWLQSKFAELPEMGPRLTVLETLAEKHELRTHLVESYKQLSAANESKPEVVWHALERSADIAENVVKHPEVAFDIMTRLAETETLRERADVEMRRLAETHNLWDAYRNFLSDETDDAQGDDAVALLVRRAAVERDQLKDWEAAFETLIGGFQDAPFDERIREPLFDIAEAQSAWPFVAKLLEVLQDSAEGIEKARLIAEIAGIYGDRLNQPDDAFSQQLRAWQVAPTDDALRTGLEARADAAGRQVDLLAAFEWHAKQPLTGTDRSDAFRRAGVLATELGIFERAVSAFAKLAHAVPTGQARAALDEADALLTIAGTRENSVTLAEEIGAQGGGDDIVDALIRGAEIATEIGDTPARVSLLQRAVAISRSPAQVRPLLIDALRDAEDYAALATALETRLTESAESDVRAATTEELMRVYRTHLGDEARALSMARRLMELRPDNSDARDAYVDQLTSAERWPDLIDHYLRRAEAADDPQAARASRLEAARVAEEHLDDPRRAVRIADAILESNAEDPAALELRARSLAGLGRWTDHIEALEKLAAVQVGPDASAVYAQAAAVLEHQLVYSDKALEMWKRAAEANPGFGRAYAEQARLTSEIGSMIAAIPLWEQAVATLETSGTPAEQAEALTALAVCARMAETPHDAVDLLARAVQLDPRNVAARAEYELALADSGDVSSILQLLDAEFEAAASPLEKSVILCRRAVVAFFDGDNEPDALKTLNRAAELHQGRGIHCVRGDIHLVNGRWDEAASEYRLAFDDTEALDMETTLDARAMMPGEDVTRTHVNIVYLTRAGYAQEAAGRITSAQDFYTSAHLEDDSYGPAIVGLARLALRRGTPEGANIYFSAYHATAPHDPELDEQIAELERTAGVG